MGAGGRDAKGLRRGVRKDREPLDPVYIARAQFALQSKAMWRRSPVDDLMQIKRPRRHDIHQAAA
jgi:hypothetical protein